MHIDIHLIMACVNMMVSTGPMYLMMTHKDNNGDNNNGNGEGDY